MRCYLRCNTSVDTYRYNIIEKDGVAAPGRTRKQRTARRPLYLSISIYLDRSARRALPRPHSYREAGSRGWPGPRGCKARP